jgi:Ni/Co efflux regulator RcnB
MHYHRYAIRGHLPLSLLLAEYMILNRIDYGLDAPLTGYEWVRYGPDLLMVDEATGEIDEVIHDVFVDSDDGDDQTATATATDDDPN